MNILLVAPEYPPLTIGGGGIVYKNLSKQLNIKGHSISVMAGSFKNKKLVGKVEELPDNENINVHFVPLLPFPRSNKVNFSTYTFPSLSGYLFILKELFRSNNAVIHLHGLCHPFIDFTALACMLMHKKYVLTSHGIPKNPETSSFPLKTFFNIYLSTIEKVIVKKAFAVTTVSLSLKKECYQKNLVNKNMIVIPNGPNNALAKPNPEQVAKIEEKYDLKNKHVIFAIGRMSPNKGFQFLIESMREVIKKIPNAVAVIAGSGPYKKQLEDLITSKGLSNHVRLVGWVSEETKATLYERSAVVVFPSVQEPFGLVILEAFAMHKPLIAFSTESALEIIKHDTGLLVPVGDSNKLADAIIQVISDPKLKEKLIANTNNAKTLSWEEIAVKYLKLYNDSVNNAKVNKVTTNN